MKRGCCSANGPILCCKVCCLKIPAKEDFELRFLPDADFPVVILMLPRIWTPVRPSVPFLPSGGGATTTRQRRQGRSASIRLAAPHVGAQDEGGAIIHAKPFVSPATWPR